MRSLSSAGVLLQSSSVNMALAISATCSLGLLGGIDVATISC